MELWSYYRVLRRWRWVIVAGMIAGIIGGLAFYRPGIGDYSATATLLVPTPNSTAFAGTGAQSGGAPETTRTQQILGRIWSSDVADRVIRDLHLNETVYRFHLRLSAAMDRENPLIRVTVSGRTPGEAMALTNALADTVAQGDRDASQRDFTVARELVERQLTDAQARMSTLEKQLLAFQLANQTDLASPALTELTSLESQMESADVALKETQARLASTIVQLQQQGPTRTEPEVGANAAATKIRNDIVQAEIALTGALTRYTASHPNVVALKAQIAGLKDQLNAELAKGLTAEVIVHNPLHDSLMTTRVSLTTEKIALGAKHDALQQVIADLSRQLPVIAEKRSQQQGYTRAISSLDRTLQSLAQQVADARLREQAAQSMATVGVVDRAQTAQPNPFRAEKFVLMFALVLGLLLGLGMAALLEYLDNTLKTPQRAEGMLGVAGLAAIPQHNPPFHEAYRMLRVNLTAADRGKPEIFAITGVKPGVGVSTIVANTARAFARAGRRTIIVDAAVHRPDQHTRFDAANDKGLTDVLNGEATLAEALVPTGIPNLELLPAGAEATRNADAIDGRLGSPAMSVLLAELHTRADVILFDTSPASMFSATLDVAPLVSGVILALDAHQVPRGLEQQTKIQLDRVGATLLGFVLTKVRPDLVDSYYYHGRQDAVPRRRLTPATAAVAVLLIAIGLLGTAAGERLGRYLPEIGQISVPWAAFLHRGGDSGNR